MEHPKTEITLTAEELYNIILIAYQDGYKAYEPQESGLEAYLPENYAVYQMNYLIKKQEQILSNMKNLQKEQEELFHKIVNMKHKMQILSGYVQNDFERCIQDGIYDKQSMREMIVVMESDFDKVITELNEMKLEAKKIMENHV